MIDSSPFRRPIEITLNPPVKGVLWPPVVEYLFLDQPKIIRIEIRRSILQKKQS